MYVIYLLIFKRRKSRVESAFHLTGQDISSSLEHNFLSLIPFLDISSLFYDSHSGKHILMGCPNHGFEIKPSGEAESMCSRTILDTTYNPFQVFS